MNKIYLGKVKEEIKRSQLYNPEKEHLCILNERLYISKQSWDCKWYWGFGYIGNKDLHCHADIFCKQLIWHDVNEVFNSSIFQNDDDFWIFKDLLKQCYALKNMAEVYHSGGHCISKDITRTLINPEKEKEINKDLEKMLEILWKFLTDLSNKGN